MTCFCPLFKKKPARSLRGTTEVDDEVSGIQNTRLYTYRDLKVATNNFSLDNKVGEGGFGRVYKAKLKDGTLAAVKVLSANSSQGVREFLTEINVIAEIENENLVKLYGCCIEGHQRILVYGYMENNSLGQTLLGSGHKNIQFSWSTRSKICIGVARGLVFLHEHVRPHIIHRDIKASNILLDEDLNPKISDFGLAKLFPEYLTHISTRVAGTAGYLAPEYALRGQLTRKADIYSFGVLLLEIVSGRSNTNRRLPFDEQYLLERVWTLHEEGKLETLVDQSMNDDDLDIEEACGYLKIGLLCTQEIPKLRPKMSTVVDMLTEKEDVKDKEISRPGLLSEFRYDREQQKKKMDTKSPGYTDPADSGKLDNSSSSSVDTSVATMTFSSIYDRTM